MCVIQETQTTEKINMFLLGGDRGSQVLLRVLKKVSQILKHKCLETFFLEVSEVSEFGLYRPPKWKTTCPSQRIANICIFGLFIKTDYPVSNDRLWTRPFTQKLNMRSHTLILKKVTT